MNVAILGLGRSGLAVARACAKRGWTPTVLEGAPGPDALKKPDLYETARAEGFKVEFGRQDLVGVSADWLVANPAVPMRHPIFAQAKEMGLEILSEPEFAYRIAEAPIVAVTGTNGKSTTAVMTWLALQGCGLDARLCGNIHGTGYPESTLTEAADSVGKEGVLVAEISSFQLEWTSEFRPASAGITNINNDHLDRYDTFEEYAETKMRLFKCMARPDHIVVRAHDPVVRVPGVPGSDYRPRFERRRGLAPGEKEQRAVVLTFGATGEHAQITTDEMILLDGKIPLTEFPFREDFNRTNSAMAGLLAYGLLAATRDHHDAARAVLDHAGGQVPDGIIEGLKRFRPLRHRMEPLGSKDGVRYVNNSMCTNVDALLKSLQSVRDPAHILIGGVNKEDDFRPLAGYLMNRNKHRVYFYGRDGEAVRNVVRPDAPLFGTMAEAFRAASEAARAGEVVILAPGMASQDQFRDFIHRGDVFRDLVAASGVEGTA